MSRPVKRPRADHAAAVRHLRAHPGMWSELSTHRVGYAARQLAHRIHTAYRLPHYEPAGAYEAQVADRDDTSIVIVRWLGPHREAALRKAAALAAVRAGAPLPSRNSSHRAAPGVPGVQRNTRTGGPR
ncbi:hypothetical protein [Streptomyces iconiensis]|uniref:Uncharacterized protein n=1 Tax=Streptomyces iconiensis TaxID=1384038 RepID=A0ABT6ZTQ0_9ACTN|nr:hypothetical protein [Streptomyces iconiensis]MDJ1132445.1 hypothetical protein [Streptomyces iconiensis]